MIHQLLMCLQWGVRAFNNQLRELKKSNHSNNCATVEEQVRKSMEKLKTSDQIRSGATNDPSPNFPHSVFI